ncbi:uncharacterized protein LOC133314059 [Gastrolobium bilobum]|uniref:uncharacterized protein LOC133314059 n=1 Tax=Gastrolobium bilobum TaxID=150636 RepID=UPI002AB2867F|nr:uncharacterized protein LOC133314059 [Gastrolobium bilobum]
MVVTTRRAEQTRAVTPEGHVQTVQPSSPPSMHSAPAEGVAGEALPLVLQSVGPQHPAADPAIAQLNQRVAIRKMQGENLIPNQPPPPGVCFGMPLPTAFPQIIPLAHCPQPARSQPVAMYNDHRVPVVAPYPPGPYTHNIAVPYPPHFPTGFPFHGYAIPPHNAIIPQPQGSGMIPGLPQYDAQQAPALSYSIEAPQAPHRPPDLPVHNPNL